MIPRERYIRKAKTALRVAGLVLPYRSPLLAVFLVMASGTAFGLVGPYMSKLFIDVVFRADPATGRFAHAGMLAAAVGIMFGAQAAMQAMLLFRARLSAALGNRMHHDLRTTMFGKLLGLSLSYFNRQKTGAIVAKVNQDTAEVQRFMVDFFPTAAENTLMLAGAGTFLLIFNWRLTLIAMLPVLTGAFFMRNYARTLSERYRDFFERRSLLSAKVGGAAAGIRIVKSYGQEFREAGAFEGVSGAFRDAGVELSRKTSFYSQLFSFFVVVASSIVWLAGGELILLKKMTLGSVVAFVGYLALAYRPIMSMGQLLGNVAGSLSAAERIFAVLDAVPEVAELPDARELPGTCCDIRFADVSFAYEERRTVFSCSFSVGSGEWVAFVGRSGAGKSTLANLLCRLHDVTEGAVTIGGMDIRGIRISDLRRRIGLVSQEAYLIDGTIADNIAYGKPSAAREEILAAARSACAHDFIVQKPEGYDTPVGEGGALLSGGEKQRIAIARAILLDPAVIIFDEATSAVDIRTENEIFASMERLFRKRTFVCIAHRLSSPRRFNRIYVMENGRIAESGTHEELMAKKSLYHDHMIREPTQTSDTVM